MKPTYRLFVATWFVVSPSTIHAQTWDGSGTPDSGGSWSTALNWTTDTVPTTGNTAVLDTTGANRVVTYDASASGSLGTLTINQTSGFTNTIDLVRSGATLGVPTLTIANAIVLGASGGGTSVITLSPGALNTGHVTLAATAGITINSGGSLIMGASTTTSLLSQINGNVTLTTGGSITISAAEVASTRQRVFNNNYTQNGGNINLDAGTIADTRLQINGTTNITGGTITAGLPSNTREAQFSMGGGTNTVTGIGDTINPVIFALGGGTQTLTTDNQSISTNGLVLRSFGAGSYNKTITHNAGGTVEVGQLRFGQNTAGARTALILAACRTSNS